MKKTSAAPQITIVSAYGRGAYLAHQLQKKGFESVVLDVSAHLPPLSSTEQEGPFGIFLPPHLNEMQKNYLCGDHFHQVPQGFSIFNSQGPLEFQGPLKSYFLKKRKDFQICSHILGNLFNISPSSIEDLTGKTKKDIKTEFANSLSLLELSAGLTASYSTKPLTLSVDSSGNICCKEQAAVFSLLVAAKKLPLFSPLFSDYFFREGNVKNVMEIRESLEKTKVKWQLVSKSKELPLSSYVVWTLSGPETLKYFPDKMPLLFPKWKKPQKIWKRFSLSWEQKFGKEMLPMLLTILPRKKEESILSLKQNLQASSIDLWLQCPYEDRSDESKLSLLLEEAVSRLEHLFPSASLHIPSQNQEDQEYFVCYHSKPTLNKKIKYLLPSAVGKMDAYSLMLGSELILHELSGSR